MSLIGKAWPDRLAMSHWITDETVAACDGAADLGIADSDLGDLPQKLINNTADKSATLVQVVLYLESGYLETYLLALQNACA